MAYSLYKIVSFGPSKSGLATVGYSIYDNQNVIFGSRTTGVQDLGNGSYGANITFTDGFRGRITWDTGEGSPLFFTEAINPETGENLNTKVSTSDNIVFSKPIPGSFPPGSAGYVLGRLTPGQILTTISPVAQDGRILTLTRNIDYKTVDGRSIIWTDSNQWPDLTGASVILNIEVIAANVSPMKRQALHFRGSVTQATGPSKQIKVEISAIDLSIQAGPGTFNVVATLENLDNVELVRGTVNLQNNP